MYECKLEMDVIEAGDLLCFLAGIFRNDQQPAASSADVDISFGSQADFADRVAPTPARDSYIG